jgi:hypothetical protein
MKTARDQNGWYLEMRIPFSSIRLKENNGSIVMGLICSRRIAHKNEVDVFPAIPPDWGEYSYYRPSKAQEVVIEGIKSKKLFYIAPYAIAGFQQDYSLNESNTAYDKNKSPKLNTGLDAKYGLTNDLTLDVNINTDFAQVFHRCYSVFQPEKTLICLLHGEFYKTYVRFTKKKNFTGKNLCAS